MDASLNPLKERIATQIRQREAALVPLRESAMRADTAHDRERIRLTLAVLDQELAGWKEVAARIEQAGRVESRNLRAIRMPALR